MAISLKLLSDLHARGRLPLSRFSAQALAELRTPLDAGLLARTPQGKREYLAVTQPEAFHAWLHSQHPGLSGEFTASAPRARNLALRRDSKGGRQTLDHYMVQARAHGPFPHLDPEARARLESVAEATRSWGAVGILLEVRGDEVLGPTLPAGLRVMTVENLETFHASTDLQLEADLFLLPGNGGRMRKECIQWLAAQPGILVRHFGDFDPVGLQECQRLRVMMPGQVSLFLPEGLEELFRRFSNRALLEADNNRAILAGLTRGEDPGMDRVLDLMARHGPLEQEALGILHRLGSDARPGASSGPL